MMGLREGRIYHYRWFILLLLLLVPVLFFSQEVKEETLTTGWAPWVPYVIKSSQGTVTGIDQEIVSLIFKEAGIHLISLNAPWKRVLVLIEHGLLDCVSGASYNKERAKYGYFSAPYRIEKRVLFVKKGGGLLYPYLTLEDALKGGMVIGIVEHIYQGPMCENLIMDPLYKRSFEFVNKNEINIKKADKNRIDGFIMDHYTGLSLLKDKNVMEQYEIHLIPIYETPIHLFFSRKRVDLVTVENINRVIKELEASGVFEPIIDKYTE